jgi:hypothetical protein
MQNFGHLFLCIPPGARIRHSQGRGDAAGREKEIAFPVFQPAIQVKSKYVIAFDNRFFIAFIRSE